MIDALWKQENYKVAVKTVSNTIENACYRLIFSSAKTHHLEKWRIYDTISWGSTPPMQAPTNCPGIKVSSWLRCTGFFFNFKLSFCRKQPDGSIKFGYARMLGCSMSA